MNRSRSIEKEIHILTPVEAVWHALTDAEELTRWFPLEARVTPGEGGTVWMSWKNEYQFQTPIAAWKPNAHLRLIYMEPTSAAKPSEPGLPFEVPHRVALDYHLEGRAGETVVRLVHTGFSSDASWDSQYEATVAGWEFQLAGLKLYLERHRGTPRRCIVCRAMRPTLTREEAWGLLWGHNGLAARAHRPPGEVGVRYAITTAAGDHMEGIVENWSPPENCCATVTTLNDAWMRVHLDELQLFGVRDTNLWISTFALPEQQVKDLQGRFDGLFARLFGGRA